MEQQKVWLKVENQGNKKLFTLQTRDEAACKKMMQAEQLFEALQYAEKEIAAFYEAAKSGVLFAEISIGQFQRLREIHETLVSATVA